MRHLLNSRFNKFELDANELEQARSPSPYFWAYLQNKIADYADAVVEFKFDPTQPAQVAILEHEKLKAQVEVLEELMRELVPPAADKPASDSNS